MFSWLNSNFVHNILNAIIILQGALALAGCKFLEDGTASCEVAWISPKMAIMIAALSGLLKLVINIGRDGITGLIKVQPPVADNVVTVVQPMEAVSPGEKIQVTAIVGRKMQH